MSACIRKEVSLSWFAAVGLVAALIVARPTQTFAQSNSANWIGGVGNWSNQELWFCQTGDKGGHCVPNGGGVAVFIGNGGGVTLDMAASIGQLEIDDGSSLRVGDGGSLTNSGVDLIGNSGSGSLTISGGGSVSDGYGAELGNVSNAIATVTGKGSQWNVGGIGISVGGFAEGSLTISDGGRASGPTQIGGSSGTVTVTGSGSQLNASTLGIGFSGLGQLVIEQGGVVNVTGSQSDVVVGGITKSSHGAVTVTGSESHFNASSATVAVGEAGTDMLTLQQAATGSSLNLAVGIGGLEAGGEGTVFLTGAGTKWTNGVGSVTIGYKGATGTFTVEDGATLSTLNEVVGNTGVGTFNLNGGSNNVGAKLTLGAVSGAEGTLNLSGEGLLTVTGQGNSEVVGNVGKGNFLQTDGKNTVTQGNLLVGQFGHYGQSAGVTSVGSNLLVSGGAGGKGEYDLSNQGRLEVEQDEEIGGTTGLGVFSQSGVSANNAKALLVGAVSSGSGEYTLAGNGLLEATVEIIGLTGNKVGSFIQTGGTNRVSLLSVGGGGSSYSLSTTPSSLGTNNLLVASDAEQVLANGTFDQYPGTHNSASSITIYGTYNLNGGELTGGDAKVIDGGALNLSGDGRLNSLDLLVGLTSTMTLTGSSVVVHEWSTTNDGTIYEKGGGDLLNIFWGKFTGNKAIIVDPATNYFTSLTMTSNGYIQASAGSQFDVAGNFINASMQNALWNTNAAELRFTGGGATRSSLRV